MNYIWNGFRESLRLIASLDAELCEILLLSLKVSGSAAILAGLLFIPLGLWAGLRRFPGKALFARLVYTLMSVPSVTVGLLVALVFSRNGPFGFLDLMYTPRIMIYAQFLLVSPLATGLAFDVGKNRAAQLDRLALTLGAGGWRRVFFLVRQLRNELLVVAIAVFSRAISEVGTVMVVGGNIKGHTRVMTTSISMLNSMGEYAKAIALGIVLISISFLINAVVYSYAKKE